MNYFAIAVEFLFGCHHRNLSRVFTIESKSYRVCCDCGAKFAYSLETMSNVGYLPDECLARPQRPLRAGAA
jgi:thiamine pyrophosphokinase